MKFIFFALIPIVSWACNENFNPKVLIETESGNIVVEVDVENAPITGNNFLAYADSGKYHGLANFYRTVTLENQSENMIKIEVIQAGFFEDSLIEKYQFTPIIHETTNQTGILHKKGTISMARAEVGTASSEFFICIGNQPELDFGGKRNPDGQGFAAFGKVVEGMDVVKKIQTLPNSEQYIDNPVKIIKVSRVINRK
jgi:peptidyl-prolyl cis-trans isomerase A (cyclophilin A)